MGNDNVDESIEKRIREEAEKQLEAARMANDAHKQKPLDELGRLAIEEAGDN